MRGAAGQSVRLRRALASWTPAVRCGPWSNRSMRLYSPSRRAFDLDDPAGQSAGPGVRPRKSQRSECAGALSRPAIRPCSVCESASRSRGPAVQTVRAPCCTRGSTRTLCSATPSMPTIEHRSASRRAARLRDPAGQSVRALFLGPRCLPAVCAAGLSRFLDPPGPPSPRVRSCFGPGRCPLRRAETAFKSIAWFR